MSGYFARARCRRGVEIVGHLRLALLPVVGKRNADDESGNPAVPGNQAPGNFVGFERDFLYPAYVFFAQGAGIVDKPLDNQFVFTAFAVRIVDDRIDAGDVGRPPQPFGQFFYGNEGFPRENTAVPRRYGNQRGVRYRIGVFQPIERNNVWIVITEMIPDVDVDNFDELAACREYRHDDQ